MVFGTIIDIAKAIIDYIVERIVDFIINLLNAAYDVARVVLKTIVSEIFDVFNTFMRALFALTIYLVAQIRAIILNINAIFEPLVNYIMSVIAGETDYVMRDIAGLIAPWLHAGETRFLRASKNSLFTYLLARTYRNLLTEWSRGKLSLANVFRKAIIIPPLTYILIELLFSIFKLIVGTQKPVYLPKPYYPGLPPITERPPEAPPGAPPPTPPPGRRLRSYVSFNEGARTKYEITRGTITPVIATGQIFRDEETEINVEVLGDIVTTQRYEDRAEFEVEIGYQMSSSMELSDTLVKAEKLIPPISVSETMGLTATNTFSLTTEADIAIITNENYEEQVSLVVEISYSVTSSLGLSDVLVKAEKPVAPISVSETIGLETLNTFFLATEADMTITTSENYEEQVSFVVEMNYSITSSLGLSDGLEAVKPIRTATGTESISLTTSASFTITQPTTVDISLLTLENYEDSVTSIETSLSFSSSSILGLNDNLEAVRPIRTIIRMESIALTSSSSFTITQPTPIDISISTSENYEDSVTVEIRLDISLSTNENYEDSVSIEVRLDISLTTSENYEDSVISTEIRLDLSLTTNENYEDLALIGTERDIALLTLENYDDLALIGTERDIALITMESYEENVSVEIPFNFSSSSSISLSDSVTAHKPTTRSVTLTENMSLTASNSFIILNIADILLSTTEDYEDSICIGTY